MPMTNPLNRLRELAPEDRAKFLRSLPANTRAALPYLWHYKARPEQRAPTGDWSTWLVMGGRGSGKTRAGAEWVRAQVEGATPLDPGPCRRVALLGETADQARDIMVLGDSGLIATSPPDRRPTFHVSRRHLIWPNGAEAHLFSASDPESLRGPQFDAAWCDELAKWKRTQKAWDMLQFGLRLGANPRTVVTTTPRANPTLIALMNDPATTLTQMPTRDNAANLAPSFLKQVEARYKGRDLGRQELKGELLTETPDAMWNRKLIAECQIAQAPPLTRIIVAVDPSRPKPGPSAPLPPFAITTPTDWWPRSTKAAIWSKPSSDKSTRTFRSKPCAPPEAKQCAPNPSSRSMRRTASITCAKPNTRSSASKINCAPSRPQAFGERQNHQTA